MQNLKTKKIIFLNGKFIPSQEARVSVLESGFLYGWGLFETMRAYHNKIVYFNQHLKRIKDSCKLIQIQFPYSLVKLKRIIKKAVEISGASDAYVRLTVWKSAQGAGSLVIVRKYQAPSSQKYRKGSSLAISQFRQEENIFFARIKTTNRLLYELSLQAAKTKGFDEALILNNRGYICEASRSNIFFAKANQLFTPDLKCGCLDGITRKVVFDLAKKYNIKTEEGNFTLQDLYTAEEAFLTNSLIGVMPLASVERHAIGCGRITKFFMQKYNLLLKNGI